jgi:D-alanine-D-alanine ligase
MDKKTIAVFFGGKSFEHDVSILTGLEICKLLDTEKFFAIPVYFDLKNQLWIGDKLNDPKFYPLTDDKKCFVREARIMVGEEKPTIEMTERGLFGKKTTKINFDVALLAFHGEYGENGFFQGMCEVAGIPYTGCRVLSSAICMNKSISKMLVKSVNIPVLDEIIIRRPLNNNFYDIEELIKDVKFSFPVIVKPIALGSSIGVSKANNKSELNSSALQIFTLGDDILIEPFVENLEEYNISVAKIDGKSIASAIERPIKKDASFLGFIEKYLSNNGNGTKKAGSKLLSSVEKVGLLSLTRVFEPKELSKTESEQLKEMAVKSFDILNCNGIVRIDFLCNSKTREFYFNEINTIPGSLAYYLWEAHQPSYSYTEMLTNLVNEASELNILKREDINLSFSNSEIFKKKNV